MTEKKKTKAKGVVLSDSGLMYLIEELKKQAGSKIDYWRRYANQHSRDQFKVDYGDLMNSLEAHVSKYPVSAPKDTTDSIYVSRFVNVGRLVAYAETLGVKTPDAFKDLVRQNDTDAPLDFLLELEALRSKHPKLNIQVNVTDIDDELSFLDGEIPF